MTSSLSKGEAVRRLSIPDAIAVCMALAAAAGARLALAGLAGRVEVVSWALGLIVAVLVAIRASGSLQKSPSPLDVVPGPTIAVCVVLVVGCLSGGGVLAARAEAGRVALAPARIEGVATIVSDAEWFGSALRIDVRFEGRRYEVWARGSATWAETPRADRALSGQRWWVAGAVRSSDADYLRPRHIGARVDGQELRFVDDGIGPFALANEIRGRIELSARSLGTRDGVLLAGFVYGDDRGQLPEVVDDFRASGLTHLLAVSGQNVAFVLMALGPLLRRLSRSAGVVLLGLVLAEFAVLTRGEPSVLRACLLAAAAVGAKALGRPASTLRLLALVVASLVLIDPLLMWSVGFQLSVAASLAIVLWAARVEARLPGPRWFTAPLSVTLAAQLGVLPIQVVTFGALRLVSVPANLLAGPVSGPVMIWGLLAGLVGGSFGEPLAGALHWPTEIAVGWVASVARICARFGGPELDRRGALAAAVLSLGFWWAPELADPFHANGRRRVPHSLRAGFAVVAILVGATMSRPVPLAASRAAAHANIFEVRGATVLVIDRPDPAALLGALRAAGVESVDIVIAKSASSATEEAIRVVLARNEVGEVWAPVGFAPWIPHVRVAEEVRLGDALTIMPEGDRLVVVSR
ncbi:MAG: competence protein ComEC [Candidatus Poriferisodalaceae bacterium]